MRVGINGFGRIGRLIFRAGFKRNIDFVAINDLPTPVETFAHLLKYDSNYGEFDVDIKTKEKMLIVNGKEIRIFSEKNPGLIPWKECKTDIVIESTGVFTKAELAGLHNVKKVIISAPSPNADVMIVMGVNHQDYRPYHRIISNASCTTNCLAPMVKVLDECFKIKKGLMTTVHSYTNDQRILDLSHRDLRRARAAAISMIPTTTGAAKAIGKIFPHLEGKLNGIAIRVPTSTVSLVDLVVEVEKSTNINEVNDVFKEANETYLKGILGYCEIPLVSCDFKGNPNSCVIDAGFTDVIGNNLIKVLGWYDNEWAYSMRIIDLIKYISKMEV
ncbi:type I glyceraldehyde-3-phosphate dehydrogenase [bacterium]|nr:type I glyceraldehyde-3-phosphate dehydrogenase [bacterium]